MEKGALVWCRDEDGDEAWLLCEVLAKSTTELTLKEKNKSTSKSFSRGVEVLNEATGERKFKGVELANTPLSNEDKEEGLDNDLIALPHLHEPAILHALSDRFFRGKIYTWTGPVLIAVNPFQRLQLYTNEILEDYRRDGLLKAQGMQSGTNLPPHVFAIADHSYRQMMREDRKSQSILISGESGAGKTESTKIVMLYLTTLGAGSATVDIDKDDSDEMSVMQRVLQSNPILEAFGNARTLRNDNSSRFGKFIELGFSRSGQLLGAKVQTYLLEKVRLAFHAAGERNYHIFYQLLRGCSEADHHKYEFHEGLTGGLDLPNYFHYTGQGGAPHLREFTDEAGLEYTLKAMRKLGWTQEIIDSVMSLIAGLLHLGQIKFNSVDKEGNDAAEVADEKILVYTARLLGVDVDKMRSALTERIMLARGEEIKSMLEPSRAADARDALSKTIYGALFLWIVDQVNISIGWKNDNDIRSSCGVLDIFGFECFAINSFEQLCINYTNEALQQQFNQFIFKLEQAEYEAENIEWAFIEFPDNQDCLDTIQAPIVGILATLDDECRLPKGSDKNFAKRLYDQYLPGKNKFISDNTRFHATNMQKGKSLFCIRHFAGLVEYNAETSFMEKNKDEIPITAKNMFETAPSQLMKNTYAIQTRENVDRAGAGAGQGKGTKTPKQKTVGQQFKEQLVTLIENIQKTDPHYIRCIKPNDAAKPLILTRKRTTEQLRYGGVLEAIRVARAGYPVRLHHAAFFQRYRMILPTTPEKTLPWSLDEQQAQKLCIQLVECALEDGRKHSEATVSGPLDPNEAGINRSEKIRRMQAQPLPMVFPKSDVQLGKTKVFMRKHPHDCLEAHRVFHQHASATIIQCWARGLAQQRKLFIIQSAVETIQRSYRGFKGRARWWKIRKAKAGILLTTVFRMLILKRSYARSRRGTIRFQARLRGYNVRRTFAAVIAQKYYKRFIARKRFRILKKSIIALQCRTRRMQAQAILGSFKREQKDVGKLKQNNERLKQEMASLRAMLAAQAKESAADAAHTKEMAEKELIITGLEKKIAEIEKELAEARRLLLDLEDKLRKQEEESLKDKDQLQKLRRHRPSVSAASTRLPDSPQTRRRRNLSAEGGVVPPPPPGVAPIPDTSSAFDDDAVFINPDVLAEHRAKVAKLEEELDAERSSRRDADGEIIRLRAAMNGVELNESEVNELLVDKHDSSPPPLRSETMSEDSYDGSSSLSRKTENEPKHAKDQRSPEVQHALERLGIHEEKERGKPGFVDSLRASAEFIPRIRRGFITADEKEEEDVVAVGWKTEIRNRREREEALRDAVHKFEAKMKKFTHVLEEGAEVVMWQLNRGSPDMAGESATEEFALKSSNVTMKMHRRGDLYVQAVLNFMLRGGYLSKTIGRNRNVDKTALEPLSLHDILEVRAGCSGFDHNELPTAAGKTKSKKGTKTSKVSVSENKQTSLFMTIKATPTPVAASRSYIFRFKSRSARNDTQNALRSILADMQIKEGVSVSGLHTDKETEVDERDEIMVPLSAVHEVMNRERESYDRILLMLLQGTEDVKEKEDDLLSLRNKLEAVVNESKEKDRVQANDSKLIMQLSKKLENLLMDNEDLRDQNDRLNTRLVSIEADIMNTSGRS